MAQGKKLKVCFIGAKQAGFIAVLTILSQAHEITCAVSYSEDLTNILKTLGISVYQSINGKQFIEKLKNSDVILNVHGRQIIPSDLLKLPRLAAVNIHPYLYKYKGAKPVERALRDKEFRASVGAHLISEQIDTGKVIFEEFLDVSGTKSVDEIYNRLYPVYCIVVLKILDILSKKYEQD